MVDIQRNYNIGDDDNVTPIMILLKVKAKLLGRQIEEKEDFMKMKDEDKENDPVDERGVDSIRQPPSF